MVRGRRLQRDRRGRNGKAALVQYRNRLGDVWWKAQRLAHGRWCMCDVRGRRLQRHARWIVHNLDVRTQCSVGCASQSYLWVLRLHYIMLQRKLHASCIMEIPMISRGREKLT